MNGLLIKGCIGTGGREGDADGFSGGLARFEGGGTIACWSGEGAGEEGEEGGGGE